MTKLRRVSLETIHTHDGVEQMARDWLAGLGWTVTHNPRNRGEKRNGSLHIKSSRGAVLGVAYSLPANVQLLREQCINMMSAADRRRFDDVERARASGPSAIEEIDATRPA